MNGRPNHSESQSDRKILASLKEKFESDERALLYRFLASTKDLVPKEQVLEVCIYSTHFHVFYHNEQKFFRDDSLGIMTRI